MKEGGIKTFIGVLVAGVFSGAMVAIVIVAISAYVEPSVHKNARVEVVAYNSSSTVFRIDAPNVTSGAETVYEPGFYQCAAENMDVGANLSLGLGSVLELKRGGQRPGYDGPVLIANLGNPKVWPVSRLHALCKDLGAPWEFGVAR